MSSNAHTPLKGLALSKQKHMTYRCLLSLVPLSDPPLACPPPLRTGTLQVTTPSLPHPSSIAANIAAFTPNQQTSCVF